MPNKKISQFPQLNQISGSDLIPVVANNINYASPFSAFTNSLNILNTPLTGFVSGDIRPISSGDTVLSAFETLEVSKQDLLFVQLNSGLTTSFINIDNDNADINIVSSSSGDTAINIINEDQDSVETITLGDDGLLVETISGGVHTTLRLSEGFELSYNGVGIFGDPNGFYIKTPNKIYFPTSTLSADTLAKMSDIPTNNNTIPIMTKAERDLLVDVELGRVIFQTDDGVGLRIFDGTNWYKIVAEIDE